MYGKVEKTRELLKSAIEATDGYLGAEKDAVNNGINNQNLKEFMYFFTRTQQALSQLGILDKHMPYMVTHMDAMEKMARDNPTIQNVTAQLGGSFQPDSKEVQDHEYMSEEADKGLAAKAAKSGISIGTLRKVYNRGMAAWRTGHRPGTTPQQWAMARVNSYIMKGKGTYYGADKDLREEDEKLEELTDDDMNKMVDELEWEDIVDLYSDDELTDDEDDKKELEEAISVQGRLKKKQSFARFKGRRNVARGMKLRRASDVNTLQRRATLAARRALYKRFLRGRNKSSLSAAEKDRVEKQVASLKMIQNNLAQRMLPKIRKIEQQRLASYRTNK
jgi:hypothetical protein